VINPKPGVLGVLSAAAAPVAQEVAEPAPQPVKVAVAAPAPKAESRPELRSEPKAEPRVESKPEAPARAQHSGWMVQVGAFPAEDEAKQRLTSAQTKAKALLGRADAFTETVVKGNTTLYRARFAGLDREQAEAVCKHLKRNEIVCMTIKN
jgi:D-alanyl-D-alanine carboxypeptidase